MSRLQLIGWACAGVAVALFFVVAGGGGEASSVWVDVAAAVMIAAVLAGIVLALFARRHR